LITAAQDRFYISENCGDEVYSYTIDKRNVYNIHGPKKHIRSEPWTMDIVLKRKYRSGYGA